ncbi:hypothetical protein [Mucilaginibacter sp. HD30]
MFALTLKRFESLIIEHRINRGAVQQEELTVLYFELVKLTGQSYQEYRRYFPAFLSVLERNNEECLKYAIQNFEDLYNEVFVQLPFYSFDLSIMENLTDVGLVNKCYAQMRLTLSKGEPIRISDNPFNFSEFSTVEKQKIAGAFINLLQEQVKVINWTNQDFETIHMLLLPLHQLLKESGELEMFYYNAGLLTDKLCAANDFQTARNFAEEIIKTGYDDGLPDLGFWNLFRIHAVTKNANGSLLSGCLTFLHILENRSQLSDRQGIDMVWQTVKLFRNIEFYAWARKFDENKPAELVFSAYQRHALDHSYFYCLLKSRDPITSETLSNYLQTEGAALLKGGLQEASPWYMLLLQLQRISPEVFANHCELGRYLKKFEEIVPAEQLQKQLAIVKGEGSELVSYLKEAILKLEKVVGRDDFVYDNGAALMISNRTLDYSFRQKNPANFLLAMRLKADYSILFKPKYPDEVTPFLLPQDDISKLDTLYDNPEIWISSLIAECTNLVWLGVVEGKLFQLGFFQHHFSFYESPHWSLSKFSIKRNSKYFAKLKFQTSKKIRGQVRSVDPEEHLAVQGEMAEQLTFATIYPPAETAALWVVKDIFLAPLPHQLLLNESGEFLAKLLPVTNILSAEWLQQRQQAILPANYSKSIWIPTESNDDTLPYLYSHLEDEIVNRHFSIYQTIGLTGPLATDLNIVCAHGANDIAEFQVLYHGNEMSLQIDRIVGKGKILILFVCHSGSAKSPLFKNESASLVSRFIQQGYEAVIAPAWALEITVAKIWLPVFLRALDEGKTIDKAVFDGNRAVCNEIPNPAAWACLHLYGNPLLRQQVDPA